MKDKILILIIGILIGAILATGGCLIYAKVSLNKNKNNASNVPAIEQNGQRPEMMKNKKGSEMIENGEGPQKPENEDKPFEIPENTESQKNELSEKSIKNKS